MNANSKRWGFPESWVEQSGHIAFPQRYLKPLFAHHDFCDSREQWVNHLHESQPGHLCDTQVQSFWCKTVLLTIISQGKRVAVRRSFT